MLSGQSAIAAEGQAPASLVEHLRGLAQQRPDDIWLTVAAMQDGHLVERHHSYGDFERRVRALAAHLQHRCPAGARALVMMDNDEHYAASMLACFYAGVIAVPVPPLESLRAQHLERLLGIVGDAGAACVISTAEVIEALPGADARFAGIAAMAADRIDPADSPAWVPHAPTGADIAFLQYTSGSTSAPKGVMVSHGNLIANEAAIQQRMEIGAGDRFVSWAPLYHDMGLIGGLLQPLYSGLPLVLTSPRLFLESPVRWLELISRHRATISGGPDFAYRMCLERIKPSQLAQLDLSSWRLAYTGAEPVRADTVSAFAQRFAPCGLRPDAAYACYGLAEATLFITGGAWGAGVAVTAFDTDALGLGKAEPASNAAEGAEASQTLLVGCGPAVPGHAVEIVDPYSLKVLESGRVGEIWARGPSISQGYWGKPQETQQAFVEHAGQRWLRTGDLGFVHGGQVHVAGRIKDLIIVRGHNLYPQDIERVVEAEVEAVRKGRVAAFSVDGPAGEGIGVAAEISRGLQKLVPRQALVDALAVAVATVFGEAPAVVVLLEPGALPRTSSGKLQRQACKKGWAQRSLDAYAVWERGAFVEAVDSATNANGDADASGTASIAPRDETETALAAIWCETLRCAELPEGDPHFFLLGGNSLSAAQLAACVSAHWGVDFAPGLLFDRPRFSECAAALRELHQATAHANRTTTSGPRPGPVARDRGEAQPLSHAQQRQWFLWHLDPAGTAYHVAVELRLGGLLHAQRLHAALERLVARHDALRTVFRPAANGSAEQHVLDAGGLEFNLLDLGSDPQRAGDEALRLRARPFDLGLGPLLRALLMRLGPHDHRLVLVMHHIVSDGVSMQNLLDELAQQYLHLGDPAAAAEPAAPALQYADYATWHTAWLDGGVRERQLTYWRRQLGSDHPVLALPSDRPRAAVASYSAAQHGFALRAPLVDALRMRAAESGASLFMVLLAGFQAVLHRYTGQPVLRLGVPVAGRQHAGTQGLIGFFVNTLVLQAEIDGRNPLAQVLAAARRATLEAQAHQDLPFDQLVEDLQPQRSLSHPPLFQLLFNHVHEDLRGFERMTGCATEAVAVPGGAAQFELSLEVRERAGGAVRICMDYAAELFLPATMERLGQHYVRMLEALASDPEVAVGEVDLLSDAERAQLVSWQTGQGGHAVPELVHAQFEQQVRRDPQATALVFGDGAWSYGELNARANRLAHHLIALGVRPEVQVGIAMERSLEMVVGLLAIMKAGGAYVPMDPEHPPERLRYMAEDSGIGVLLIQSGLMVRLPRELQPLCLAVDALDLSTQPAHDPAVAMQGENLVYVIYTSGSTGRPKGAGNRHRALCNRLAWGQRHHPLGAQDTVLQKTPFSFDISFWEFFWPLSTGARLALAGPGEHRDPARIAALVECHAVSCIHFVPSMLQAFLSSGHAQACSGLRHIVCSGEALPAELRDRALTMLPGARLLNLYGPTEAAIEVTYHDCSNPGPQAVPIGRPLDHVQVHVVDASFHAVPRGVAGELLLGGLALARGYWGRPALTAERFVASPSAEAGERAYRTGDLVRWNEQGEIEYLGRLDHQVKIRGFRVELGEIEAALLAVEGLREAVVVAAPTEGGSRLVAYLTGEGAALQDPGTLKAQLVRSLPDYMVPALFVRLDTLPLNSNGKVDRKALPVPTFAHGDGTRPFEAPEGGVAKTIAAIWRELLQLERVGANESFFDLGGHSLLLIRAHRLIEDALGSGLSVIDMFQYPTVATLARRIEAQRGAGVGSVSGAAQDLQADERAQRRRAALLGRRGLTEEVN
ncbi:non-ribosomal peptide synthetase [Acidovorax sp. SUPP3434]|uniref:non-ribosomal peptide synthetase n=1 Tax=Acidovorax sp. SUPP3434 TaxID=2920880 RepID=UPI0023DE4659|nr:non-ribosomal peptide synthetase [Acidovorax sp. SUPP3434]GKT02225.1 non-ribosomal peptide synthetase [Acidovorax sp. SUPP3434]